MKRKEVIKVISDGDSCGLRVTLTRKGIEVDGWYDHYVGIYPADNLIPWEEVNRIREEIFKKGGDGAVMEYTKGP